MEDWKKIVIPPDAPLREAMEVIDLGALRTALVCRDGFHLLGTITDGDIRRALLKGASLDSAASEAMNHHPKYAEESSTRQQNLSLMEEYDLLSLPVVTGDGRLLALETQKFSRRVRRYDNPVFIMAGGFGTRLRPLTDTCPKPMLPVGKKPLLEHLILQFTDAGFYNFYISTHYMPEQIREHFGDGEKFGISVKYVHEDSPLGTGGALGLLPNDISTLPLILMNGDVLTKVDFEKLLANHVKSNADATMCVRELEYQIPYGVVECDNSRLVAMVEKPTYRYRINTGIYVLSSACIASVEGGKAIDMPTLLQQRHDQGEPVNTYTSHDYWLDIGRMDDYKKAQIDIDGFYR